MADHYEVVSKAPGFGSRLSNSVKGVVGGIALILISLALLWWGEGRQNLAEFIKAGKLIDSNQPASVSPGTLVKTTGRLHSDETIVDDKYLIPGAQKFLSLRRNVEMYAWKEKKKTEKKGDKEVTTYDYVKEWTSMPSDSSRFYDAAGHRNPSMGDENASFQAKTARIGALTIEAPTTDFHGRSDLAVTEEILKKDESGVRQLSSGMIYIPYGVGPARSAAANPEVGDLRIKYSYFPNDVEGSAVGQWDGAKIVPHIYRKTESYLGVFAGSLEAFQARLQGEHTMTTWIIRILTLLMLWAGLNMILGPILTVLDSIPIIGGAGRFVISLFTGAIAFLLWALTILLAKLWLALLIVIALLIGLMVYKKTAKRSVAVPAT